MPRRPLAPGDIVQVLWEDAQFDFDGAEIDAKDAICNVVGHLVSINKKEILLAAEIGPKGIAGDTRAKFRIPRSIVRKTTILKRGGRK